MNTKNTTQIRHGDQSSLLEHVSYSPARLFLIVAASILVVEIVIMFAFERLPQLPRKTESILDGTLLTILVSPILYGFLFRPLNMHIAALRQAQELLRQQRDHLEEEVQKRTAELVERNREITDREVHYRAVVEGASEGILTLDNQGQIVRINAAAEKMFGYAQGSVTGMYFVRILTDESVTRYLRSDGKLYPVSDMSLEARHKDGKIIPILLSVNTC